MDVESLAQIRNIVTEAVQGVREEIAALGTELRSEIMATKQHMSVLTSDITATKQHMGTLTEEITGTKQQMGTLTGEITDTKRHMNVLTEEIAGTKQQMGTLTGEITDTKRHMGVLTEGARHEVQLVAEAVQLQSERMTDVRHEVERQARETRALFQLSYEQLHQRVGSLEQRLQMNE